MEDFVSSFFEWLMVLYGRTLLFGGGILLSVAGLVPAAILLYLVWLAISAGQRRQQRARCFLDLLEIGLKAGRTVEATIQSLASNRVQDMGVRFHLLAAWMERGLSLSAALAEIPRFLPDHIRAMLRVGEELGDVGRVLPVCRGTLKGGSSNTQKNLNTLVVLLFVSPIGPVLVWTMWIFVFPKFRDIVQDMLTDVVVPADIPVWSSASFHWSLALANLTLAIWVLFFVGTCLGDISAWLFRVVLPSWQRVLDALSCRVPWRRRRMQRDFSALLALLLDAGIPELKAVRLAAAGTGNASVVRRAERVSEDLQQGTKLTEAVRWLDDQGEFRWRLRNAAEGQPRFAAALAGWQEALEAKAFQQEQMFSQAITTSFVLLNGLMVGLATVGVFKALIFITNIALW